MLKYILGIFLFLVPIAALATVPNLILGTTIIIQPIIAPSTAPSTAPTSVPSGLSAPGYYPSICENTACSATLSRASFPNAYGVTTELPTTISSSYIRSYSVAAWQYYNSLFSSGVLVNDAPGNDYTTTGASLTTYVGSGIYVAQNSDPVWNFSCASGFSPTGSCYAGWSQNLNGVHVPYGASTQTSGQGGCDCHLFIMQPLHWVPGSGSSSSWPDIYPLQYEVDIQNGNNQPNNSSCSAASSTSCTVFNGSSGTNLGGFTGAELFGTGTSGWGGGSLGSINDGYNPGDGDPAIFCSASCSYGGAATSGQYDQMAFAVSAEEILNGSINHATGGYIYCLQNSQSGSLTSKRYSDSLCNGNTENQQYGSGGNINQGWAYGDLLYLNRTDAQLNADNSLNPAQRIWMSSLIHYGFYPGDTEKPYGGHTFGPYIWKAGPSWAAVATKYSLPRTTVLGDPNGVVLNMFLPQSYFQYIEALNPCIINHQSC